MSSSTPLANGNDKWSAGTESRPDEEVLTYREALRRTMHAALQENPNAIILGQGVDDHKGMFGTTTGLAEEFGPHRVFDTPLSEDGVTGIAIGAALNGLYPIQTHIRVDFALLAMNQIVNLAAKYRYMSGGRLEVPMLIRMVIGRSWGQGAQHSQSLQSLFGHIPGLTVLMPASPQSILESYSYAISEVRGPVIAIEHRLMYDLAFRVGTDAANGGGTPLGSRKVRSGKDVTIVATSIMVLEAMRAAQHLEGVSQIDCEIIDLSSPSHIDKAMILESVARTGRLLVADTSWLAYGVCAEVCRIVCEHSPSSLKGPVVTLGMQPAPCPTAKSLEDNFYPTLTTLTDSIAGMVVGRQDHGVPLPDERSMADVYKRFRGPF